MDFSPHGRTFRPIGILPHGRLASESTTDVLMCSRKVSVFNFIIQ